MDLTDTDDAVTTIPVGRVDTGLGPFQVNIVHGMGTVRVDPSTAIQLAISESLVLGPPVGYSVLSGGPGYLYRTHEMQLLLTNGELNRLVRHNLAPEEYFRLRQRFGEFFEIEDSFYDPLTGTALQPV